MAISFDKAFGVHQYTLSVRAKRAEVLSSNIADAKLLVTGSGPLVNKQRQGILTQIWNWFF